MLFGVRLHTVGKPSYGPVLHKRTFFWENWPQTGIKTHEARACSPEEAGMRSRDSKCDSK
ncbi:hypothetical protein ATPR_0571 [Acetobacter tropicalis NBRC 101654]|uniref:Uncharacterized protein n=1 Tax=Acetobacter tropicalis NBRC 101654 TaxID=749388 RepID=F7VB22_9PROT|nr:hypothetical protein ATPR_0571 [Acetobacter tropicalis NBRC 101654]